MYLGSRGSCFATYPGTATGEDSGEGETMILILDVGEDARAAQVPYRSIRGYLEGGSLEVAPSVWLEIQRAEVIHPPTPGAHDLIVRAAATGHLDAAVTVVAPSDHIVVAPLTRTHFSTSVQPVQ